MNISLSDMAAMKQQTEQMVGVLQSELCHRFNHKVNELLVKLSYTFPQYRAVIMEKITALGMTTTLTPAKPITAFYDEAQPHEAALRGHDEEYLIKYITSVVPDLQARELAESISAQAKANLWKYIDQLYSLAHSYHQSQDAPGVSMDDWQSAVNVAKHELEKYEARTGRLPMSMEELAQFASSIRDKITVNKLDESPVYEE
eukprot:TRINITY_DN4461_c0_g1_i1.p1 TRINITY_DN4461_c0_g1~~TRINITY_DN4461_c0_g1_i1.p1  ORF type:complete len:202 (-),score=35.77 TRINITY_DN4461_c0_g1_i1:44-649(-)